MNTITLAILFSYAASFELNTTEEPLVEHWKYNLTDRREILRGKFTIALGLDKGEVNQTPTGWSLDSFLDNYLASTPCDYETPDDQTINDLIENNENALFRPYVFEDSFEKYGIADEETEISKPSKGLMFKDFTEKYRPITFWERVIEEKLIVGRNDTHNKRFFSLINTLDSTDELLSLEVPRSGRRWWNDQWQLAQGPEQLNEKIVKDDDIANSLLFMKQTIYQARQKMTLMQHMRNEFKNQALFKMGYLFAKTDYACKIFSSLAFKAFRACSMIRQKIFFSFRLFHHYIDIAYNIERLESRWFDVDILKDLLTSNDLIARKVVLKDKSLKTPEMVVKVFDEMFID